MVKKAGFALLVAASIVGCSDGEGEQKSSPGTGGSAGQSGGAAGTGAQSSGGTGNFGNTGGGGTPALGSPDCPDLSCLACASGSECAKEGPFLGNTCCAAGDALQKIGEGTGSEVVDMEYDGRYVYMCGGFGVRINDLQDPTAPKHVGEAAGRCQRVGIGETLPNGSRVFYLAHHGDSWVATPFLGTYHLDTSGKVTEVDMKEDAAVLFEGLAYHQGHLYNAAHDGGLRVYQTAADGVPTLLTTLSGFTNAWKVDIQGNYAYVADGEAGLKVVDISTPAQPKIVNSVKTLSATRDVDVDGNRVYVAMGGSGVDVFDATDPVQLAHLKSIATDGSAQAVQADGKLLAVAAWSHVALYETKTWALIATERTRRKFEQDLGIAIQGDLVMTGEWEGLHVMRYRPGYVAPDVTLKEDIFTLEANKPTARAVVLHNRGLLPLLAGNFAVDEAGFSFDVSNLEIAPSKSDFFQLTAQNLSVGLQANLTMQTNDPDPFESLLSIPIAVGGNFGLGVGDSLTSDFGFLDPSGAKQVAALKGKVVVLAYFALF